MRNTSGSTAKARWRLLIDEQEQSGRSVREFADARGLSACSLYGWRSKLGRARQRRVESRPAAEQGAQVGVLLPVDVVPAAASVADEPGGNFEVIVNGRARVRVPKGFDVIELTRVLEAVTRSC